jgi:hypothetical protein
MHTVGNAPNDAIRSMPAIVLAIGSTPAITSPDTAPRGILYAQYAIASRNRDCPSDLAFPGQTRANQSGSKSSTQKDR